MLTSNFGNERFQTNGAFTACVRCRPPLLPLLEAAINPTPYNVEASTKEPRNVLLPATASFLFRSAHFRAVLCLFIRSVVNKIEACLMFTDAVCTGPLGWSTLRHESAPSESRVQTAVLYLQVVVLCCEYVLMLAFGTWKDVMERGNQLNNGDLFYSAPLPPPKKVAGSGKANSTYISK